MDILKSNIDASVNYVDWQADGGAFESRFVQRSEEYFITYLSSHTGCNKACRMCHLTQSRQTMMRSASIEEYLTQATVVLDRFRDKAPPPRVNYNFMARGEPLSNPTVTENWRELRQRLTELASGYGVERAKFNVSTIMPSEARDVDFAEIFAEPETFLYYSLYSMRDDFRRKWLPKAIEPDLALDKLLAWQRQTGRVVTLHWAFIKDQNDDIATLDEIIRAVHSRGLMVKFNAVRYNPYSDRQGEESPEDIVQRNFQYLDDAFGHENSRIVPKVGFDAKCSCGMFVQ